MASILFIIFLIIAAFTNRLPKLIMILYIAASIINFICYFIDKSAAVKGRWRIKENTLHLFSIFGGWPGAILAQKKFRHKTQKKTFQITFWITILINCTALGWLFTPKGASILHTFNNWSSMLTSAVLQ